LPTSLPHFILGWKFVQAGVHKQLWQRIREKGMWKISPDVGATCEAVLQARIPLIPVVPSGDNVEFLAEMALVEQMSEAAIRWQQTLAVASTS
jgi:hypothetical protein